ncbi:MAG TPA: hypothetical protein VNI01_06070 [Elusimicrobiota bacterium]|jgi:hypothetical protein|nr:hypothetical protein [Elusimicrobiota bacterium]
MSGPARTEAKTGGPGKPGPSRSFAAWEVCAGSRGQVEQAPETKVHAGRRTVVSVWPAPGESKKAQGPAAAPPPSTQPTGSGPGEPGFAEYWVDVERTGAHWVAWSLALWGDVQPLLRAGVCAGAAEPLRVANALIAARSEKGERLGAHYAGSACGPVELQAGRRLRLALDPAEFDSSTRVVAWRLAATPLD